MEKLIRDIFNLLGNIIYDWCMAFYNAYGMWFPIVLVIMIIIGAIAVFNGLLDSYQEMRSNANKRNIKAIRDNTKKK